MIIHNERSAREFIRAWMEECKSNSRKAAVFWSAAASMQACLNIGGGTVKEQRGYRAAKAILELAAERCERKYLAEVSK